MIDGKESVKRGPINPGSLLHLQQLINGLLMRLRLTGSNDGIDSIYEEHELNAARSLRVVSCVEKSFFVKIAHPFVFASN